MELQSDRQEWWDGQQPSPRSGKGLRSYTANVSNCKGAARNQLIVVVRYCSRLSRRQQGEAEVEERPYEIRLLYGI